jgi:L-lactate dehydrogenase complex protein LldG
MTARDVILAGVRRSLGVSGAEAERHAQIDQRLAQHPRGVVPTRGQLPHDERIALFRRMVAAAAGTSTQVPNAAHVPREVAALLRSHNLPLAARRGTDAWLAAMPWQEEKALTISVGASAGGDAVGLSHAFAGVAETGTLVLLSGPDNPTSLNFLPDAHVVMVAADDIVGDYETVWDRLRAQGGFGAIPRTLNLITGPSRSADIGQTLILGAHGPRRLHVIVVE